MHSHYRNWKSLLCLYCAVLTELPTRAHACRVVCGYTCCLSAGERARQSRLSYQLTWLHIQYGVAGLLANFPLLYYRSLRLSRYSRHEAISTSRDSAKITLRFCEHKQDTHCTDKVTVRRVRVIMLTCKINKDYIFWMCVYSLSYLACRAHAPCCHLLPAWLYKVFFHIISLTARFLEKNTYWTQNVCFEFLYDFILKKKIISIPRRNERDVIIKVQTSSCKR